MHILGTYGHINSKYEVSKSNPVAERVCTDDANDNNGNNDNGQKNDCIRLFS